MKTATRCIAISTAALVTVFCVRDAGAVVGIAVTSNNGLGFGQIVATAVAGSVTVTPAGNRSSLGGAALGNSFGAGAASFSISGEPNTSYSVTLPESASLAGGASSMTVDTFTSSPAQSGTLGSGGLQEVTVGATLHVGVSQPQASYSGTFAVTVTYN